MRPWPNLKEVVQSVLDEHDLPGCALVLEITERALIGAGTLQTHNVQATRALGVRISLDDFGSRGAALVQAILALAQGLSLKVVAEGIETPGQRRLLVQLGCQLGQGYLFARPCPAAELPPAPAC